MVNCRSEPFPYMGKQAYSRSILYRVFRKEGQKVEHCEIMKKMFSLIYLLSFFYEHTVVRLCWFIDNVYIRSGCRNTVMQMIAEKSVNCSLMSLPPTPGADLPTCGPLEGAKYFCQHLPNIFVQVWPSCTSWRSRATSWSRIRPSGPSLRRIWWKSVRTSVKWNIGDLK